MERLLLKAATTATDEGIFEAVISTASVDRDRDIVEPAAMVAALKKWADVGKLVPLAWAHSEDVVGHIEPMSVRIAKKEVIASGWIDQSDELGAKAWGLVKSGTLSFSFGYLIPKGGATERPEGGLHIKEIDVFEISVVPIGPANNDTRVLSFKSAEALREETRKVEREVEEIRVPDDVPALAESEEKTVDLAAELESVKAQLAALQEATKAPPVDPAELREQAKRVEREVEEIKIPDVPEPPKAPAPELDLATELQEVKATIVEMAAGLEDLRKKANVTDKGPEARSVDSLRKQANAVALEIASGGQSLHKPPPTVAPKRPEPALDLRELKRRTRDEMLGVLSGGIIE